MSVAPGQAGEDDEADDGGDDDVAAATYGSQRVDKWLWFSRAVKSRTLAGKLVEDGKVRLNRSKISKPSHMVKPGDVLTISVHLTVRVLKVLQPGKRRGPASEAQLLYEDLTVPEVPVAVARARPDAPLVTRERGLGRPTKRDRRLTDRLRSED